MTRDIPHISSDHDLSPDQGTDAADADALDARLNEIAHSPRRATAWPVFRPKRRSRQREAGTGDLPRFAQAFHQRAERAEAADGGSQALDPTLWEQIMVSTNATARVATARPGPKTPTAPSRGGGRAAARPVAGRPFWTGFANATLAVVLLLAAFGVWQVYDRGEGSPPTTPEGTHSLAFQPEASATPETMVVPPIAISTPEPVFACDFSQDMPIFSQVDESPVDGTALLVTTSGELVLSCPEESDPIVLATNIGQAAPAQWPGTVYTVAPSVEGEVPTVVYVNAVTDESVEVGTRMTESSMVNNSGRSPWHVAPAPDDSGVWAVTDLRTMETRRLSSFTETPETFPPGTSMMTASGGDTVVVGIRTENGLGGEGYLFGVDGLPGTLLVVNGSFDNAHWIEVPEDLANTQRMELSPDGQFLALKSNDGEASFDGTITYTIIRVSDGAEVARSEGIEDFSSEMRWVQDGAALAYTNTNSLMLLTTAGSDSPVTLLESPYPLANLYTTYDSDVILARQQQPEEVATETPELVQPLTYSVNTVTGESLEIPGADASINMSPYEQDSRFMVMADAYVTDGEPHTYRVIDPVTGEQVGELTDVTIPIGQGGYPHHGRFSIASTDDGSTEVLGFSPAELWLMTMGGDSPVVRQITSPPGKEDVTQGSVNIFVSPDGSMLSLTVEGDESGTRWILPLDGETDEWIEVPSIGSGGDPGYVFFVPGPGEQR